LQAHLLSPKKKHVFKFSSTGLVTSWLTGTTLFLELKSKLEVGNHLESSILQIAASNKKSFTFDGVSRQSFSRKPVLVHDASGSLTNKLRLVSDKEQRLHVNQFKTVINTY